MSGKPRPLLPCLVVIYALLAVSMPAEGLELQKLAQIPTGSQPKSVRFAPDGKRVFCPLLNGRGIEVIDCVAMTRLPRLQPPDPWAGKRGFVETAIVTRRNELWVTQMTTGLVHVFSLSDSAWLCCFPTGGSYPKVIALSADERTAYVSNWVSRDVSVIDVDTRTLSARVPVKGTPRGMVLSADQLTLFTCDYDSGAVFMIDCAARTVEKTLSFGKGAMRHILRDPRGGLLYASDMLKGRILAIDPASGKLSAELHVDEKLNTIDLSPEGGYLFVSSRGPNNPSDYTKKGPRPGKVYAIDTANMAIVGAMEGGYQPTGLAVSPDGALLAFSNFLDDNVAFCRIQTPH